MPNLNPLAYALSSVWVGDFGNTSKQTRIDAIRYNGCTVAESLPGTFIPGPNIVIQTGNWTVKVTLNFYVDGKDELPINLSRGLTLSQDSGATPDNAFYSLLLVPPDSSLKAIYIPKCFTENTGLSTAFLKTGPQTLTPILRAESRSVNISPLLIYRDTLPNLQTQMGSIYPLS